MNYDYINGLLANDKARCVRKLQCFHGLLEIHLMKPWILIVLANATVQWRIQEFGKGGGSDMNN